MEHFERRHLTCRYLFIAQQKIYSNGWTISSRTITTCLTRTRCFTAQYCCSMVHLTCISRQHFVWTRLDIQVHCLQCGFWNHVCLCVCVCVRCPGKQFISIPPIRQFMEETFFFISCFRMMGQSVTVYIMESNGRICLSFMTWNVLSIFLSTT